MRVSRESRSSWWFAFGLVMTSATHLRLRGLPLGVGELALLVWLAFNVKSLHRSSIQATEDCGHLLFRFWLSALVLLATSTGVAVFRDQLALDSLRSGCAFVFTGVCVMVFCVLPNLESRLRTLVTALIVCEISVFGSLYVAAEVPRFFNGVYSAWYYQGFRFTGFAENPNQAALHLLGLPFLLAARGADSLRLNSGLLLCVTVCVIYWLGLSTLSDALLVSWLAGAIASLAVAFSKRPGVQKRELIGMALLFLVMSSIWYRGQIISHATQILATNVFETRAGHTPNCDSHSAPNSALAEMSRRSVRFALWKHGIDAMLTSPVVGLGPGAYSGITKPFDRIEAHNSLIDWGTNTGIVGVALFAALILSLLKVAWRNRNFVGIIGIFSLLMFAQFHYVFRQPIFWFYLLVFSAGSASSAISVAADRPQALQQH